MTLTIPIFRLKRLARKYAREARIPLHSALDQIAQNEGFRSWSQLAEWHESIASPKYLLSQLTNGGLHLLAARPGHGKTLLGLELLLAAIEGGRRGYFFTLEYTPADVLQRLKTLGVNPASLGEDFILDTSDDICADYIIQTCSSAPTDSIVVVDYLQLLDQQRYKPRLNHQLKALKKWAQGSSMTVVLISQIDRKFETSMDRHPGPEDIRLPNPLDLGLFETGCFLHEGEVRIQQLD